MANAFPWVRALKLLLINTVLWWVLSGGQGWGFGLCAILITTWLGLALPGPEPVRYHLLGAAWFVGYFLIQSVLGGFDVARRAFSPKLPLSPCWKDYPLRLRGAPARTLYINAISLLPGTLSAELKADAVVVHALNPEALDELPTLEARVGGLFGQTLEEPGP